MGDEKRGVEGWIFDSGGKCLGVGVERLGLEIKEVVVVWRFSRGRKVVRNSLS